MKVLPQAAGGAVVEQNDNHALELVARFVDMLGSSSGQLSSLEDNGVEFKDCLSPTLKDDDAVCSLPSFRVEEEEEDSQYKKEKTPSIFWKSLEKGVRSVLQIPVDEEKAEEEPIREQEQLFEQYTKATVDSAPLELLRKLQDALRSRCRSRLNEWKTLLKHHPSDDAQELAKHLTYHKMVVGCRGNTSLCVFGIVEPSMKEKDISATVSEDGTVDTEESSQSSVDTRSPALACRLQVKFFVKLRHGPRSFGTSSFTLAFELVGIVRYSFDETDGKLTHISFECDERHILESMKSKANALVLKAVAYQAADTVRWSRTFLSDLWEAEHIMRDEDSFSDSTSTQSLSTFGTIATYISSLAGSSNGERIGAGAPHTAKVTFRSMNKSRYARSRLSVPADIITRKNVKSQRSDSGKEGGWQQSPLFQLLAFLLLFGLSVQLMTMKEFCHSLFRRETESPRFSAYRTTLRRGGPIERSPKGVSFHRVISTFPEGSQFLLELKDDDTHCHVHDNFGVNDCHFNWKEEAVGNFSTAISTVLDESSSVEAHLVLEGRIPYKLNCALCGQPCEIGLPAIDFEYTFHMPDCPVDLRDHFQDFHYQLWSHSPTDGMIAISLEGTAIVYSAPGEKLAEFQVVGTIR